MGTATHHPRLLLTIISSACSGNTKYCFHGQASFWNANEGNTYFTCHKMGLRANITEMSKKENAKILFGMKDKNEVYRYVQRVYAYMWHICGTL